MSRWGDAADLQYPLIDPSSIEGVARLATIIVYCRRSISLSALEQLLGDITNDDDPCLGKSLMTIISDYCPKLFLVKSRNGWRVYYAYSY